MHQIGENICRVVGIQNIFNFIKQIEIKTFYLFLFIIIKLKLYNMIIIPDVHGRTFWKGYIKGRENEQIVFLGDYLDPYPYECLNHDKVIENFKEIIEFKKSHMNNVTLILGNHDFAGYVNPLLEKCRFMYSHETETIKLFSDNLSLFTTHKIICINNKTVLLSHSFAGKKWLRNVNHKINTRMNIFKLLDLIEDISIKNPDYEKQQYLLEIVGIRRGGWSDTGSIIWADVSEAYQEGNQIKEIDYQIFGHSQQESYPVIRPNFACLDVREGFTLTDDGTLISENLNINTKIL